MSEIDVRGNPSRVSTLRYSDQQVINLDYGENSVEINDEEEGGITLSLEDFDNFRKALDKAEEHLSGDVKDYLDIDDDEFDVSDSPQGSKIEQQWEK